MNWSTEMNFSVEMMIVTEIDEIKLSSRSWKTNWINDNYLQSHEKTSNWLLQRDERTIQIVYDLSNRMNVVIKCYDDDLDENKWLLLKLRKKETKKNFLTLNTFEVFDSRFCSVLLNSARFSMLVIKNDLSRFISWFMTITVKFMR